ncbi:DNA-binding response regulator [Streptomyces sp. uw30]|uniref:response regulator transcription factor n=1 Tax=Streptomyces sp. uw30 TaxID=1828179 RepID=UPI0011CE7A6A|nr:response regulator transcription factor [Streptomyces sp. uw30]TXS41881.1 DNA-binding response regulator [Streptomyces sp. uw30]
MTANLSNLLDKPPPPRGDGQRVLVVADDPGDSELLRTTLQLAGYRVGTAGTGAQGLDRLTGHGFDLAVWDAVLLSHLTRLPRAASRPAGPPVLFLTTCDSLHRLVPELGAGEQDYVTKPLRIAEVLARVDVLLRRRRPDGHTGPLRYGDLVLDDATCRARRGSRPLDLTPAEYRLLRHLLGNAGCVLSKEQIGRHVWGEFRAGEAIEKLVSRLRRKVDRDPGEPALIHTRRGFGYWLGGAA